MTADNSGSFASAEILLAKSQMFCFCSHTTLEEGRMRRIDREELIVLGFGWLVALAVTLT
jgi:hypothetical protein